jgi:hypothetical protein
MNKVISLEILGNYKILLRFQDGDSKIIDFYPLIGKGVSEPLLNTDYFKKVAIDNGGGIEWPNGFDFCPNYLKEYSPASQQLT